MSDFLKKFDIESIKRFGTETNESQSVKQKSRAPIPVFSNTKLIIDTVRRVKIIDEKRVANMEK